MFEKDRSTGESVGILFDKLTEYAAKDYYPYHMPGHKRQGMQGFPEQITNVDITEIAGFDNLHQPEGILLEAQKRVAKAYGAEESFFLVNGSTCGILSAVSAAVPFGGHLLISRNCHKAVYHGAYLRHLRLSYIYPHIIPEFNICEAVTPEQVEKALQKDAAIQAVLVVSPTYEGRIADIKGIAEVVHGRGIPLIVDEAHGAHLGFAEGFALNSARLGADLVINSVHKTLPAMTQTALLHCNGQRIDREQLRKFLHIYQSSSPSYILMASIEHAVLTAAEGAHRFRQFRENWNKMLQRLKGLKELRILPDLAETGMVHDMGKLVVSTDRTHISGKRLADMLRENYHLEMEMACETYVLAMFTIADTEEGYERLSAALIEMDEMLVRKRAESPGKGSIGASDCSKGSGQTIPVQKERVGFCKAWDCEKKEVSLAQAEGCPAGEFINLYPPGIPIVVPGEVVSREVIQQIKRCMESGLEVQGVYKDEVSGEAFICCIK